MKSLIITSIVMLAGISGEALAACAGTQVTGPALATLISGSTVCAASGSDTWQEQHRGSGITGELWDYKKGSDPVDPTAKVGTWSIASDQVTYAYTGGPSYTYSVYDESSGAGTSYCFSGTTVVSGAKIKTAYIGSCP